MNHNFGFNQFGWRQALAHWWWLPVTLIIFSQLGGGRVSATDNQFDPGNIISDQVLTDTSTMTVDQIQEFLESRVRGGACDRDRQSERAKSRGYSPPWTCLYEFQQNPTTGATNYGQFDDSGRASDIDGGLTAAEIIHQAANDYSINPQVILVLLQKQQGLVIDNWPWPIQYSLATGYSCPAGGCDSDAAGFYRQINGIAQELRQKLDGQTAIPHQVGTNQIAYNHDVNCGVASVRIRNQATAVLYSLEPYIPNQAALDNLAGTGDDCSSYGNRNFWVQFLAWFGPPNAGSEDESSDQTPTPTSPATTTFRGYQFDPGNIISDQVLTDTSTMTVDQIQEFLESRVRGGACDRDRQSERAKSRGYSPPWTCLYEFQQNPTTGATNYGQFDDSGRASDIDGGLTAAEIIHQAANDYSINPQVILVLLQKEQELIADNWPWPSRYAKATGWACPDDTGCDPDQAGFYHQVTSAAKGLRGYIDNLESWWYRVGTNQIAYHPNKACGHQTVNIKNRATAGLYLYTPYVPNQAALDNLHGQGDSCSTYGNRNFWVLFITWFGNPTRTTPGSSTSPNQQQTVQVPTSFTPGNIISDRVFNNSSSMTVDQIQAFLEQQLGANGCNRDQTSAVATRRGYSPPWTCLYEFQQNPTTGATNYGQFDDSSRASDIDGGLTAAEIIHQAASQHRLNPQVLLTMLEINHNLVSDDWPWPIQFDRAANWSCQDDNCPSGSGFYQQVNGLAQQLRQQVAGSATATYRIGQQTIAYHRDLDCGIGMVNIQTQATAALYDQYPYLPNQSVVANYPQNGDSCGSHQVRDFWKLFKGWFNATH